MRLVLLTALTMVAFAANSVLNRLGVADGQTSPMVFATVRVVSGALALAIFVLLRRDPLVFKSPARLIGAGSLAAYMVGFSLAYLTLDAGIGALILFGGVQITMFAYALIKREAVPPLRYVGAAVAFAGLVYLLAPGAAARPDFLGSLFMLVAAVGWGIYSLAGRAATNPLATTAANFICTVPLMTIVLVVSGGVQASASGIVFALMSGIVTSAMGYALWYSVLPKLEATIAATAQLTVPVIALVGGMLFLGEAFTMRFAIASILVLGGVALSLRR